MCSNTMKSTKAFSEYNLIINVISQTYETNYSAYFRATEDKNRSPIGTRSWTSTSNLNVYSTQQQKNYETINAEYVCTLFTFSFFLQISVIYSFDYILPLRMYSCIDRRKLAYVPPEC